MRRILDQVYRKGVALDCGDKKFRLFFGQDVDDSGQSPVAGSQESIALLLPDGEGYMTFLVRLEEVPTDGSLGVFELREGLRLLLRVNDGKLQVF